MSNVFDVNIKNGKLLLKAVKQETNKLQPVYESGWDLLTAYDCDESQWLLVFNLYGPALAQAILAARPSLASKFVDEYFQVIDGEESEKQYVIQLGDDVSRLTHILRERFSVVLRTANKSIGNQEAIIEDHLSELKQYFAKIPKYIITSAHETLNIFFHSR